MFNSNDVLRSYSTEHGIVYCADRGVCLKLERDGDKTNKYILESDFLESCGEVSQNFSTPIGWEFWEWMALSALCGIVVFLFRGFVGLSFTLLFCVCVFPQFILIANMVILSRILKKETYVKLARNRGAERKVQNAYMQKGEIPTIEEAKNASRIVKEDSLENHEYTRFLALTFYFIMLFIEYFIIENTMILLVAIAVYFMVYNFKSIGSFLQLFTTLEPSTDELELAIEGLKFFKQYKTSTEQAFTEMSKSLEPVIDQMVEICEEQPGKLAYEFDIDGIKFHQLMLKKSANGEFTSEKNLKNAAETIYFLYFELLH